MNIENIVIVGGGSSGWMTAAAIAYMCPEINLTLIESSTIPNIGVGESTLGHINKFFHMLDMKDKEYLTALFHRGFGLYLLGLIHYRVLSALNPPCLNIL